MSRPNRRGFALAVSATILLGGGSVLAQNHFLGPARCVRCHVEQATWWQKEDGPPSRGHVNALAQLDSPAAKDFARRLGLIDVYASNGTCVGCHATVFRAEAREGVSCESCHGPGGGYLDVHAQPGAYRLAVAAGMADVVGQSSAWTGRCLACHALTEKRLLAAGHPSGKGFKVAEKFVSVARHWKSRYTAAAIAEKERVVAAEILAGGGPRVFTPEPALARSSPSTKPAATPPPTGTTTTSPVGRVAALQSRAIVALMARLERGEPRTEKLSPPPPPDGRYLGIDADLVRLQREALALAVEALEHAR